MRRSTSHFLTSAAGVTTNSLVEAGAAFNGTEGGFPTTEATLGGVRLVPRQTTSAYTIRRASQTRECQFSHFRTMPSTWKFSSIRSQITNHIQLPRFGQACIKLTINYYRKKLELNHDRLSSQRQTPLFWNGWRAVQNVMWCDERIEEDMEMDWGEVEIEDIEIQKSDVKITKRALFFIQSEFSRRRTFISFRVDWLAPEHQKDTT